MNYLATLMRGVVYFINNGLNDNRQAGAAICPEAKFLINQTGGEERVWVLFQNFADRRSDLMIGNAVTGAYDHLATLNLRLFTAAVHNEQYHSLTQSLYYILNVIENLF